MDRIVPSKLGGAKKGPPRLGSNVALIDALPDGAFLFVPHGEYEPTQAFLRNWPDKSVLLRSDMGGIHGSLRDVPDGADVGIALNAFCSLHEIARANVLGMLESGRYNVLWA